MEVLSIDAVNETGAYKSLKQFTSPETDSGVKYLNPDITEQLTTLRKGLKSYVRTYGKAQLSPINKPGKS
eukprot:Clim_evm41s149 gene=Clim_evmTU41s149